MNIAMLIPGLQMDGDAPETQSLGGSESAGVYMARALAAKGANVQVFCNTGRPGRYNNVLYRTVAEWAQFAELTPHDVAIVQRTPQPFGSRLASKLNVMWCHDLPAGRSRDAVRGGTWNIDLVAVVSKFMAERYKAVYDLPDHTIWQTRNGLDLSIVPVPSVTRDPYLLVYAARPERGLDVLLDRIVPKLFAADSNYRLAVCGYHNPVEHLAEFYGELARKAAPYGERIMHWGALTKPDLYSRYAQAGVYVYPTPSPLAPGFSEVSPVHGDTVVDTVSGPVAIKDLAGKKDFYVYSLREDGTAGASKVLGVRCTRRNAKVITLRMRPGLGRNARLESTLTLTPDHEVMLRDGTYIQARRLKVGDRVMAMRVFNGKYPYTTVAATGQQARDGHRVVMECVCRRSLGDQEIVHHKDGNERNNDPANLELTTHSAHRLEHLAESSPEKLADINRRRSETSKRLWRTPEGRASRSAAGKSFWETATPERIAARNAKQSASWVGREDRREKARASVRLACAKRRNALDKRINDGEWLAAQVSVGRSYAVIAKECGVALQTVYNRAHEFGLAVGENHVITAVESAPNADVYCMEVEPDHNFVANGVVVHNCMSLMEAQACGMPVVSSNRGALPETLHPQAGVLVDGDPWSDAYVDSFVEAVLSYRDPARYLEAELAGQAHARTLSWDTVAAEWLAKFDSALAERNNDRVRLAHHFYRRSDIFAAKQALTEVPADNAEALAAAATLSAKINHEYAFARSQEALEEHYRAHGLSTTARLEAAGVEHFAPMFVKGQHQERRFREIAAVLAKLQPASVLDYGCGHGWSTNWMANELGGQWLGVDIDPGAIAWATKLRDKYVTDPERVAFATQEALPQGHFDAAVCSEVLEHVLDPAGTLERVEAAVRLGGHVVVTVPYGPSEYATDNWLSFRNHLWELELDDINDILGRKQDLRAGAVFDHACPVTGEPVGYYLIVYKADHAPLGTIDWARKLRKQRPRQTLSVSMMAGPKAEYNLRWCLDQLKWIADEIVVADTGMNEECRRIFNDYGARIVPSVSPLEHGFERPRNDSLDACLMDWVLWVDTDEHLIDPWHLTKYLRQSLWDGLGVRQVHLAVDTGFPVDTPVRLFRRKGNSGRSPKFYGCVHEHPELGLNEGPGLVLIASDLQLAHIGYLAESGRRLRFTRNDPMMQKDREKYPNRLLQKHFIMRDNLIKCRGILEVNGGKITSECTVLAEEVCAMYREHFLGKRHYANIDPLSYYSVALRILGKGIDFEIPPIKVARDGIGPQMNGAAVRFASVEEATVEFAQKIKDAAAPFTDPNW